MDDELIPRFQRGDLVWPNAASMFDKNGNRETSQPSALAEEEART